MLSRAHCLAPRHRLLTNIDETRPANAHTIRSILSFHSLTDEVAVMSLRLERRRSLVAESIYGLFNPIPFGCFVAALIFDVLYLQTAVILWDKGAAWLIVFGLLFAIVPRVVNLTQVWVTSRRSATRTDKLDFWLNLVAIVVAVVDAFVHSRDAFAVAPTGVWLSGVTVILLVHWQHQCRRAAGGPRRIRQ